MCLGLFLPPRLTPQTPVKSPPARGKRLCLHGTRTQPFLRSLLCFVGQPAPIIKTHFSAKSGAVRFPAHWQGFLTTEPSYWQGTRDEEHGNLISPHYADLIQSGMRVRRNKNYSFIKFMTFRLDVNYPVAMAATGYSLFGNVSPWQPEGEGRDVRLDCSSPPLDWRA